MLKCEECERTFEENELATWNEDRGEFWGSRCFETMQGCPYCFGGAVVEYNGDDEEGEDE